MRDVLEAVARGDLSPEAAEAQLRGYATTESGRFDAAREQRRGIPEAILAEGKTPEEVADLALTALETTGRALLTRTDDADVDAVRAALRPENVSGGDDVDGEGDGDDASGDGGVAFERDERARTLVVRTEAFDPPELDATVAVVSAGTADAAAAGEAAVVARTIGARIERVHDVGVANLSRILDVLDTLRAADVVIVAAGREGALPTVVAGLIDTPVIGLPVAAGYGMGGDGEAALYGMLQSCTVLSVVNVGAGFVAGAQAGLIARAVDDARRER